MAQKRKNITKIVINLLQKKKFEKVLKRIFLSQIFYSTLYSPSEKRLISDYYGAFLLLQNVFLKYLHDSIVSDDIARERFCREKKVQGDFLTGRFAASI